MSIWFNKSWINFLDFFLRRQNAAFRIHSVCPKKPLKEGKQNKKKKKKKEKEKQERRGRKLASDKITIEDDTGSRLRSLTQASPFTEMSKLLHGCHLTSIHRRSCAAILSKPLRSIRVVSSLQPQFSPSKPQNALSYFSPSLHRRNLSLRAFDSSSETKSDVVSEEAGEKDYKDDDGALSSTSLAEEYPTGDFEFKEMSGWMSFVVKLRMLIAFPWERVRKGSVFTMKLRGQVLFSI